MKRLWLLLLPLLLSCEQPQIPGVSGNVVITFSGRGMNITRGEATLTGYSRLNVSIFDESGNKVASEAQKSDDINFGTVGFTLSSGTYKVAAVAHSQDKSVSILDVTKVAFSGSMTDIAKYYDTLDVSEENDNFSLPMDRAVGMFKIILEDDSIPSNVNNYTISYTGSKSLNLVTGLGATKAKQTDSKTVSAGTKEINFFLLPSPEAGYTITLAAKVDGSEVAAYTFENISIKANSVTAYEGKLYNGIAEFEQVVIGFYVNREWNDTITYKF